MTASRRALDLVPQARARAALQLLGVAGLIAFWGWAVFTHPSIGGKPFGVDASAYWGTTATSPYSGAAAGLPGAYLYSPAFLQALTPLRLLPWEAFMATWLVLELVTLAWLVTPFGALIVLAFPPVASEVLIGNIHVFLAAALVLSVSRPWTWGLALLTKPSLGIAMAWYPGRRQWRQLFFGVGITAAIGLTSFVVAPSLWFGWMAQLAGAENRGGPGWTAFLLARLLGAGLLAFFAGRRNRPAFLPVSLYLALPIPWLEGLTLLTAVPRLARREPPAST